VAQAQALNSNPSTIKNNQKNKKASENQDMNLLNAPDQEMM
jgi:hypothetical protein